MIIDVIVCHNLNTKSRPANVCLYLLAKLMIEETEFWQNNPPKFVRTEDR